MVTINYVIRKCKKWEISVKTLCNFKELPLLNKKRIENEINFGFYVKMKSRGAKISKKHLAPV